MKMEKNSQLEYEKAVTYIVTQMKKGELTVGSKLPTERVLSSELGISRNSTREAISVLTGMGLVERKQGSGNYISQNITGTLKNGIQMLLLVKGISAKDICDFRRSMEKSVCMYLLENGIARKMRMSIEETIENLNLTYESGIDEAKADELFHAKLIEATDNKLWIEIMEAVSGAYSDNIAFIVKNASGNDKEILKSSHEAIYKGILSDDSNEVMKQIDIHYDIIEKYLRKEKING